MHSKYKLNGIVHPKMKIVSSFTHAQVVPNLYAFFVLPNTKEDILKNVGTEQSWGNIDFHIGMGTETRYLIGLGAKL